MTTAGSQSGGASSKPLNSKPGDTVQPTSVQAPSERAACQTWRGTTACGCSPTPKSVPSRRWRTLLPSSLIESSSGAPA